jgi:hypothetical protein
MNSMIKTIFKIPLYFLFAILIFSIMTFVMLLISEYLFLEPYFAFHIPNNSEFGFILILILSGLASVVIPMNIYRIRVLSIGKQKISGGVTGSFIGIISGACSCGPIGFAVISTFGSLGATATAFLTNFEIPIRIVSILILAITFFTTLKSLKVECRLDS